MVGYNLHCFYEAHPPFIARTRFILRSALSVETWLKLIITGQQVDTVYCNNTLPNPIVTLPTSSLPLPPPLIVQIVP